MSDMALPAQLIRDAESEEREGRAKILDHTAWVLSRYAGKICRRRNETDEDKNAVRKI